jgi:hypothetical protein
MEKSVFVRDRKRVLSSVFVPKIEELCRFHQRPESGSDSFPQKLVTSTRPHGVTPQKGTNDLFTAVRISDLKCMLRTIKICALHQILLG